MLYRAVLLLYRVVLLLEATVSPTLVEQRLDLTAGCISSPCGGWKSESAPSAARSQASTNSRKGDSGAVPILRGNTARWRALVDTYSASTLGAKVQCLQSLTSRCVKPGANPISVAVMIEDVRNMRANGSYIEDEVFCLLFLRASLDEYNVIRQMLERKREKLTIDRLRTELRARYDLLKEDKSRKRPTLMFLLLEQSGETVDTADKNAEMSAVINKRAGELWKNSNGQDSSSGAGGSNGAQFREARWTHTLQHLQGDGAQVVQIPKRICSVVRDTGHDRNSCPQVVKEDANLAISDGDRLTTARCKTNIYSG